VLITAFIFHFRVAANSFRRRRAARWTMGDVRRVRKYDYSLARCEYKMTKIRN